MDPPVHPFPLRCHRPAQIVSQVLGTLALVGGVTTMVGWAGDWPFLTQWGGHGISMFVNTAIAAVCAGGALLLLSRRQSRWVSVLGGIAGLIGMATLFEHLFGVDLGIDTCLVKKPWGMIGAASPGRMGPPAALAFGLLGIGFIFAHGRIGGRLRFAATMLGLATTFIALLALTGYLFNADELYAVPQFTGVAFQTAIILAALGLGLSAAIFEHRPVRELCEDSGAGLLARRALPFVIVMPMLLGWLHLLGEQSNYFDSGMGTAMLVLMLIVLNCAVLWWSVAAVSSREQTIREADRRKDEFLATLAHELRNPLAPIRNSIEIMKQAKSEPALIERARTTMERQMAQMVRLTDDLLDVSRIARDKLDLQLAPVTLSQIVEPAVEAIQPMINTAGHNLMVTLPKEPIRLYADQIRLTQVLDNLLTNACKYTEPGGQIWLTAERVGDEAIIRVQDNGLGIPADMLPRVFEMFAQVGHSIDRAQGGLGIGLTLVRRLVKMHGGSVEALSEGPGQGSEFVIRLPAGKDEGTVAVHEMDGQATAPSTPPSRRVLVVDDNKDSAESLAMLLQMSGNETRLAYDGLEAVQAAEQFRPDLVLLDIGLPKMNGLEACRRIREQPWGKGVVLVALTGWGQESDRQKSKQAGFDHHLVKPMDFTALTKLLGSL
ncbi:MAG: ATP-binding protein [Gemmataceae bacterium]